jgi:hypothetical protein
MRTFIMHNRAGDILSVCRTDFVSPHTATPFGNLGSDELVLEVADNNSVSKLTPEEIHDSYQVSVAKGTLIKKR